ncbi:hypothetical protein B0H11DRAFT_2271010 [Mycena galericulata]|nr:hypothetical protein B0H11DRAFT_2271010 [Mycena galericulata]
MSSLSLQEQAQRHAEIMTRYLSANAISSQVLGTDPQKRDSMWNKVHNSTEPHVRHDLFEKTPDDAEALLRGWDEALAKDAISFEDHFNQLHYTTTASMFYERDVLSLDVEKYGPTFYFLYQQFLNERMEQVFMNVTHSEPTQNGGTNGTHLRTPSSPPALHLPNIDLDLAKALLAAPDALLSTRFYKRDDIPGYWYIKSINRSTTRAGELVHFIVVFKGEQEQEQEFEVPEKEVLDLLISGCISADP